MNEHRYDGWAIKYGWGWVDPATFSLQRTDCIMRFCDIGESWRTIKRRYGHKCIKVKLVEVSNESS